MTLMDAFGSDVSLDDPYTLTLWNKLSLALMAHSAKTSEHLTQVLDAAPNFALAHAFQGLSYLTLGRRELVTNAQTAYLNAVAAVDNVGCTERELYYVDALGAWLKGFPRAAANMMDTLLVKHPHDPMALKLGHGIRFILGDHVGMRRSIEAVLPTYNEAHPAMGYVLGCHAFSVEEAGEYRLAESQGRKGLELAADDAWGLHAVAHVFDMTNQVSVGEDWLGTRTQNWAHCNNFGFHVWWHLALFKLAQGKTDEVLALYDEKFRAEHTDDYRDISNAASMLVRLELEGISVGTRWDELAALSEKRVQDGCLVFADLHYILPLARKGKKLALNKIIQTLETTAKAATCDMDLIAKAAGLPAAQGLCAYYSGDFLVAYQKLSLARPAMQSVGGSHAQRDVFERITIDAAMRANMVDEAKHLLSDRTHKRGAVDKFGKDRTDFLSQVSVRNENGNFAHLSALPA